MSEAARALTALLELMARLRDPEHGCPWDRAQNFASIAPYTIEEAYEVADAIERADPGELRAELGDLLFQVVFHARLAEERGWFGFAEVAQGIRAKLTRRHPHLFAGATLRADELVHAWEEDKARERAAAAAHALAAGRSATLTDVPLALPALTRATKLGRRAARVGFDWPEPAAVLDKVREELHEVESARTPAAVAEEIGDVLFAVVNWSRHLEVDAESALRAANVKFERRFARMEALARERQRTLESLSAAEWQLLWDEAKCAADPPG